MAVQKTGEGHGSPFELLMTIAYSMVSEFDYQSFVNDHPWLLDLVAAAGKAGCFTMDVVEANVPEDFQETATPPEVMALIEFMNQYSAKKGWPSLMEIANQPGEEEVPKAKRPYQRKTRKGPYLRPPEGTSGRLSLSKPALIKKHGTAMMALATIQSAVDKAGGVAKLAKQYKVKPATIYNLMTILRKAAAGTTSVRVSKRTRRTTKRKTGKREFRIRKYGLRGMAKAMSRKKAPSRKRGRKSKFRSYLGDFKEAKSKLLSARSVVALAKAMGVHPNSLTTFFHKEYGVTPSQVFKEAKEEGAGRE